MLAPNRGDEALELEPERLARRRLEGNALDERFERERPDIDVRWLDMGSQEILDRLRFEQVNPQADVWFGGPTPIFDRGVEDSLLQPYRPSWAERVGPNGIGPCTYAWSFSVAGSVGTVV